MSAKRWIAIGALWMLVGVALGALGAHALKPRLIETNHLDSWRSAEQQHLLHALGLIVYGLARRAGELGDKLGRASGWLLLAGSLLFSGSIYWLCLDGPKALGPITPLGGVLMIAGWACFALAALRSRG